MPLDEKSRLKIDKVFMAFGSMMKAADPTLLNDRTLEAYADAAWAWSIRKVSTLVDHFYEGEKVEPQSPPSPKPVVSEVLSEIDTIVVKSFAVQSQGVQKNGTPWTRYQIKDEHNINYYTFHSGYMLGESYEVEWEWRGEGERKYRFIPEKGRHIQQPDVRSVLPVEHADYDDSDIPF